MSTSQALQQFAIHRQWDAYTTLGIGHRGNTINLRGVCQNAAGNACGWRIEGEQFQRVRSTLQQMESEPLSRAIDYLQELASVAVCQWHTDQQWTVIAEWETMLRNATGQFAVQVNFESLLEQETRLLEQERKLLEEEREKTGILVKHVEDLEAKINSLSPTVFAFGAGVGTKLPESSTEKSSSLEVRHNELQAQLESFQKLAEKMKTGYAEEKDEALLQAASTMTLAHSKDLETLQDKMQYKLSEKDVALGKLQTKLGQAENFLHDKTDELSALQTQKVEVDELCANLALQKSNLEGKLRVQKTQRSSQETKIHSLQDELRRHQDILSQTLAVSENAHSKARRPTSRVPGDFDIGIDMQRKQQRGAWTKWVDKIPGFGKNKGKQA